MNHEHKVRRTSVTAVIEFSDGDVLRTTSSRRFVVVRRHDATNRVVKRSDTRAKLENWIDREGGSYWSEFVVVEIGRDI